MTRLAHTDLEGLAEKAGQDLEDAPALEILRWAADTFGSRFCVTSSMEDDCTGWHAPAPVPSSRTR
ncbi:hypothetical protein SANTM175S_04877 [Streptomyces antimycoticus]